MFNNERFSFQENLEIERSIGFNADKLDLFHPFFTSFCPEKAPKKFPLDIQELNVQITHVKNDTGLSLHEQLTAI
jgi:hypothetical protein